jgi:hypothetical protein
MIVSRIICRNQMLCDGTPRREKGFRAYVRTIGPDINKYYQPQSRYYESKLFSNEQDAIKWEPILR